ncbi:uncharacterized protein BO96DRAFT_439022 [Aspergillus niger CBS 101883]|uniref:Uncharacterized protein n=2 Tax=Aspergillus niger TaxID=5061 RepID=A2Q7Y5_ASPNC|nr:uncharacterized protein BO96DRAFT_439022 [Aspergillus niger CBS 101883]XP_059603113.1 hypothetical protein An01g02380 [Aspergillus niger]PYH51405.1 hypothetical protein BO96DRAFT_439022 [Aspergillus niger CBS 101883]CAK43608.1 hypothetical protein An01g02380 [Aspergillus niger]
MEEARERKRERTVWRDGMDRSIVVGGRGGQRRQDKKDRRERKGRDLGGAERLVEEVVNEQEGERAEEEIDNRGRKWVSMEMDGGGDDDDDEGSPSVIDLPGGSTTGGYSFSFFSVDRIFARESSVAQFPHPFFPLCWPIPIPFAYGLPRSNLPGSTASYYGLVNWV